MELEFTGDQQELRESVRSVLEKECPIGLVREVVEKGASAAGLWSRMVELDWPALTIAERHGGVGLGFVELAVVVEELGRFVAPGPFLSTVSQFVPIVREAGSDEQCERFLGRVASGEATGTLAVAEGAGRWSPDAVTTTAVPDGDGWVLHGEKRFVFDGAAATEVVVAARLEGTSGADGIALFVVPGDAIPATPFKSFDASRQYAHLALDGVRVPADRVLGEPGRGAAALGRALEEATAALALEMVGTCQTIFDIALEYAKVRKQFGVAIGSFQAMKHKFSNMFVALEAARATAYFACATIAEDDERRSLAVSMAKSAAGDCQKLVAQEGIQSLGGIGYTWEHDMHLYVKRAKAGELLLGGASEHRARVADLIGL